MAPRCFVWGGGRRESLPPTQYNEAPNWVKVTVMQKTLIIAGVVIIVAGLCWPWLHKLPLGRLPGDILIRRPGLRFYFPITTMIVISVVISLIMWLFRK